MHDVAIDVGSGVTKMSTGAVRRSFPSWAGLAETPIPEHQGYELEESGGATVKFRNKTFVVGERAYLCVNPAKLVNTRDDEWFEQDAYLALMYAALAEALPDEYDGDVSLCTGLPQALYNEHKGRLIKRLTGKHRFCVNGVKYVVNIDKDDLHVMPQVMGLFLSRLPVERSLQVEKVALIDVGTYTSDWTIIEQCKTVHWAAGGLPVGISNVIAEVGNYLRTDHRMDFCSDATISEAIRRGWIMAGKHRVNLADQVDEAAMNCVRPMIDKLREQWGDAKDARVIVGGGGGPIFGPAIRTALAHAQVIDDADPIYSIVDGYSLYLVHRRRQQAA